jgi:RNA polymerase sigma factor (sigma-70 family)
MYQYRPAALCTRKWECADRTVPNPEFGRKMVHMGAVSEVTRLVRAGVEGDQAAWNELVRRYAPLVMAVIRNYGLTAGDAQDISQTVWLRLVEHLADLREPEALPGWLVRTTQRECGRHVRRGQRVLTLDPYSDARMDQPAGEDVDAGLLRAELRQALRDGLAELPAHYRSLLRLYASEPPKSYKEISELLGIPIGSIGPKLRRGLNCLRDTESLRPYLTTRQAGRDEDTRRPT